jgi:hypothetical protein
MSSCEHEWVVFSTALTEVWLMVQCVNCGLHGTVDDPTKEEWNRAFDAPDHPYRWDDAARVAEHPAKPRVRYVQKRKGLGNGGPYGGIRP